MAQGHPILERATTFWLLVALRANKNARKITFLIDMHPAFKLYATKLLNLVAFGSPPLGYEFHTLGMFKIIAVLIKQNRILL